MVFELQECSDADMPRTFAILSDAFAHIHPYIENVFPEHDTPAGRAAGAARMLDIKLADPHTKFLKVVDTDYSTADNPPRMIAQAKWNVYDNHVPDDHDLDGEYWDSQDQKELAQHLYREYLVPRRKAIRESGGNLLSLDLLTVDPEYQRRGAGRMLVKWGTALADKMGVQAVVESSQEGRGLYESEGFEVVSNEVIDYPERWASLKKQEYVWMIRPARKKYSEQK